MKVNRRGLTLVELLLTLGLAAMVIQVLFSIFFVSDTSYSISTNKGFAQQEVRFIGDFISTELKYVSDISKDETSFSENYYSLSIKENDRVKFLIKTTENEVIYKKELTGNWEALTLANNENGNIKAVMEKEEGIGNRKTDYNLELDISTINEKDLNKNIVIDLLEGETLYYKYSKDTELNRSINMIDNKPSGNKDNKVLTYMDEAKILDTVKAAKGTEIKLLDTVEGRLIESWRTKEGKLWSGGSTYKLDNDIELFAKFKDSLENSKIDEVYVYFKKNKNHSSPKYSSENTEQIIDNQYDFNGKIVVEGTNLDKSVISINSNQMNINTSKKDLSDDNKKLEIDFKFDNNPKSIEFTVKIDDKDPYNFKFKKK